MRTTTADPATTTPAQAFDLDIRALEAHDAGASLIRVTDDNCGSTCPQACATNIG
jgi:FxLD family lantipeptide